MRINSARLQASLEAMAQIGRTPGGGVTRLALSDEDKAARDLLARWLAEAGLTVQVDDFGNMLARRPGSDPAAAPVRLGSHLDTVRQGGRFDGALGVLAALEVVRTLNDAGAVTRRPIEIANWTNEEGARFEPAMLGSGAATGRFTKAFVYGRADREGRTFGDELVRIGYCGDPAQRPGPAHAYLELHIEQGPVLEEAGVPVGVVEGIIGITWCQVTVEGQSAHAGTMPLARRRDALQAAAHLVLATRELARQAGPDARATVGRLVVEPNVTNVIPGRVSFSVDFRHPEAALLDRLVEQLHARAEQVAAAERVRVSIERFWTSEPTPFDPAVKETIEAAVRELGLPFQRLWSGAGHDAKYMQDCCPSGMIFVRSQGGLSHCEQEASTPEDIAAGANVLLAATLRLAELVSH